MQISDQTFLITGGGSGLGAACAARLTSLGGYVVVADVNVAAGRQVASSCGDRAEFLETDVTSDASVHAALDAAGRRGSFRGVVNCAGILGASRLLGREGPHDLELFQRVIQVNLVGTFNVIRLAAERISKTDPNDDGERGVIINTSSVAAFEGQIGQTAYAASKGAVASMTLPIARELERYGIRVVAIAPGVFDTPMMQAAPDAVVQTLLAQTVFPKRFGRGDEYAQLVQQIIENPMLNGNVIRLDGAVRMAAK